MQRRQHCRRRYILDCVQRCVKTTCATGFERSALRRREAVDRRIAG